MLSNKRLLLLPGDGIGPEVMNEVRRVIDWMDQRRHVTFDLDEDLVGGIAIDNKGTSLTDETLAKAMNADAVLLGAVGGPKWDGVARDIRPEAGLLKLRKEMDLFANLRPATVLPALAEASSLKEHLVSGLDILILRELTSGVYFGTPRGLTENADGTIEALDSQRYTSEEIERIMRVGFELAGKRNKKIHSVEKANVMETGVLWRRVATEVGKDFPDIDLEHMYADNCAMQLVREPKQFDVIVTDNLFGDILSDCAAMLTGSLGMLPSASLGAADESGRRMALYEPVHGSAPDIAGENKANPLATLQSFAMMLRYSFDDVENADLIHQATINLLNRGLRTPDIMQNGKELVSCSHIGKALCEELDKLAA
ncbi:MAG: 3-isopropylmalate dehydrogenase [Magnetovibrio sp.]|nr:3-isopropylmalate dehydrogenase [Magnetovibrio sp.]